MDEIDGIYTAVAKWLATKGRAERAIMGSTHKSSCTIDAESVLGIEFVLRGVSSACNCCGEDPEMKIQFLAKCSCFKRKKNLFSYTIENQDDPVEMIKEIMECK